MINDNLIYSGTKFRIMDEGAYIPGIYKFILADSFESGFIFQIISIDGFNPGKIIGYIKIDPLMSEKNTLAVTRKHFLKEIKRNFICNENSVEIYSDE